MQNLIGFMIKTDKLLCLNYQTISKYKLSFKD